MNIHFLQGSRLEVDPVPCLKPSDGLVLTFEKPDYTEASPLLKVFSNLGVWKVPVKRWAVKMTNVDDTEIEVEPGEVQLYVSKINHTADRIEIIASNGRIRCLPGSTELIILDVETVGRCYNLKLVFFGAEIPARSNVIVNQYRT